MMEVCRMTQERYKLHCDVREEKQSGVRQQFVPYMIRNLAGCCVSFATQTSLSCLHNDNRMTGSRHYKRNRSEKEWCELLPGDEKSFNYNNTHEKQRHKRANVMELHQIVVKAKGWRSVEPVTVSKVGTYFRHVVRDNINSRSYHSQQVMRIVFDVSLEGTSAKKIITVRSALAIKSRLKFPLELRLEGAPSIG